MSGKLKGLCDTLLVLGHLRAVISLRVQKFGFINGVDNVNWPPYRDSKS